MLFRSIGSLDFMKTMHISLNMHAFSAAVAKSAASTLIVLTTLSSLAAEE